MNNDINKKAAHTSGILINTIVLAVHIGLFFFYRAYQVTIMEYFNSFSILLFLCMYILIKHNKLVQFIFIILFDTIVQCSVATVCVGTNCGFLMLLIALPSIAYYSDHISHSLHKHHHIGLFPSVISGLCFLGVTSYSFLHEPLYVIPSHMEYYVCLTVIFILFATDIVTFHLLEYYEIKTTTWLEHQATNDALTGIPNRYKMLQKLEEIWKEEAQSEYYIGILDIDNFKKINDTYGHDFGDKVLKHLASLLTNYSDTLYVCRWGGEEFLMIGTMNDGSIPEEFLQNLVHQINESPVIDESHRLNYSITLGVALASEMTTADEVIQLADKRLYVGKYNGKNTLISK